MKIAGANITGDDFMLTIQGFIGHDYQFQRCDTPADAWQNHGPARPGNNAPLVFNDPREITWSQ